MKNKKAITALTILGVLLITFPVVASINSTNDLQVRRAEAEVAGELTPNGNRVIAIVNGENILAKDYLGSVEGARFGTEDLEANIEKETPNTERNVKWLEIRGDYSPEEIALGFEISKAAEYAEAKSSGLDVSLEEARLFVQKNKQLAETKNFSLPEPYQKLINEVGEDTYWNELAARAAQKNNSISALKKSTIEQADTREEGNTLWADLQAKLIKDAQVEIVDKELLADVSAEKAKEYMIRYPNLPR